MSFNACDNCGSAEHECECKDLLDITVGELDARLTMLRRTLERDPSDRAARASLENLLGRIKKSGHGILMETLRLQLEDYRRLLNGEASLNF